jgi:hypothetical protein
LPDGILSNKKSKFRQSLEGLAMKDIGYFIDIWSPLRPFGIFCGNIKKNLAALESPLTYQW